jgi:hypothetical protein
MKNTVKKPHIFKLAVAALLLLQPLVLAGAEDGFLTLRRDYSPLFTVKTNLLYDLALTPNVGLEVPLGDRWSISADFLRGWWLKRNWSFCWQVESFGVEGRFWLSDRTGQSRQGGWFIGAFVQTGFYDFQLKRTEGVQGEHTVMPGFSAGYTRPLRGGWSLEFTLGAAYLTNDYRRYSVEETHDGHELIRLGSPMRFVGVMPCKVGVSLQYTFTKVRLVGRFGMRGEERR